MHIAYHLHFIFLLAALHRRENAVRQWVNQMLEPFLRCVVSYEHDDWMMLLPILEFTYKKPYIRPLEPLNSLQTLVSNLTLAY